MTEEQKFFLDLRGWILLPSVLTTATAVRTGTGRISAVRPADTEDNRAL